MSLVSVRNLEGKGRNPFQIHVWDLQYDEESHFFSVADFSTDQWTRSRCPHKLVPVSFNISSDVEIVFEKDVDALKLINWLRTEGVSASERMRHAP